MCFTQGLQRRKHNVLRSRLFQESIDPPQLAHMKPTMISTLDTPLLRLLLQQASTCKANTLKVHPTHAHSHANPTKLMAETVGKRHEERMWLTRWVLRRGLLHCYNPIITWKNNTDWTGRQAGQEEDQGLEGMVESLFNLFTGLVSKHVSKCSYVLY